MILPDYPIQSKENDRLKRAPLALKVADLISSFRGSESFVIGIEGKWGAGKTSFINMVLESLGNKIFYFVFNPWNFTDQSSLLKDFFSTFSNIEPVAKQKNLKNKFSGYAKKLSDYGFQGINLHIITFNPLQKFLNRSLMDIRDELNKNLVGLKKKVVVVIDDIDRLDIDETKLIFKLVKLTANFPNTVFLLAYDRTRVEERLTIEKDGFEGNEYLKKIIQVSFNLPEPDTQDLRKILFNDLDETINGVYGEFNLIGEDEKRWHEILYAGFGNLFKTIRDIKRYISSLRLNWSIVDKDDINIVDFIAIEAIRVFSPRFYSAISSNRSLFTGTSNLYAGLNSVDDEAAKKTRYNELLQEIQKEIKEPINRICKMLFPQLDFVSRYGSDLESTWRIKRRICADERFGFYFQLGIPAGAISESEVANLIKTLSKKKNFSDNIIRFNKENRLRPMLSKMLDHIEELTVEQSEVVISSLWDLEKQIDDKKMAMFDFDEVGMQTNRIAYQSLLKIIPKHNRANILKNLIENTKSIYYPSMFVSLIESDNKKKTRQIDDALLTDEEISAVRTILLKRINNLALNGSLSKEENFIFLLFRWKQWGDEKNVNIYIENLIKEKSGLLDFIRGFIGTVISTAGNYKRIDKKSMRDIYPIEKIEELIAKVTDNDLEKMEERNREAINLFRNPPENDW
ncbi:MAG: hypothetical protein JW983_04180 [Elusimicrobia bacterium]|nr:hypothetical protein [Elusimicrobiota bacterium]